MKARLPRKRKKQIKKIITVRTGLKAAISVMTIAQCMTRTAMIASNPFSSNRDKALSIASEGIDSVMAIKRIMSEPPNTWKDYLKTKV